MAWIIGCLNFDMKADSGVNDTFPGTWGAFNSLLSPPGPKTNIALVPPLMRSPPTQYDTLYTGLMRARAIATHVMGPESLTVVTLDLQLYDMAMKLWMERDDIRKQFLFRPGELHVVFCALAALGKYVEGSGIDQAWVEAGLYSPTTVTQILNGKHMYRALEAHSVTLIALYSLFFRKFLQLHPDEGAFLQKASTSLEKGYQEDVHIDPKIRHNLRDAVKGTIEMFESRDILKKIQQTVDNANKIQHFINNYMKQFETILQFVRATRERDLLLHMHSLESLIKYFFAHDHLNYARLLPLYISTMQETQQQQPGVWAEFVKGNFCVTKGNAGYTSIGPDHSIEHEIRKLKVTGGIVGITQNENSLDKFFLIAPELSNIQREFEKTYSADHDSKRAQHHELTGGKLSRLRQNAIKLCSVFYEHGNPFESTDEDEVYNLLTKAVMTQTATNDIIHRDEIGQQMFESFVTERLTEGKLSVWDKMNRRKLETFKSANASTVVRMGDKMVKMKEERGLLQRCIIISRSRPELDLKECIGTYEFGIVPRSLFASDGSLLLAYDKASILHQLEKLDRTAEQSRIERNESTGTDSPDDQRTHLPQDVARIALKPSHILEPPSVTYRVIIVDGMALVNSVSKSDRMKTCQDFAESFLAIMCNIAEQYDEVRLVFDRYLKTSLKEQMRTERTHGKSTYYHVKDSTLIQNITLKGFLSDIRTKAELTEYLADKIVFHSRSLNNRLKKLMVTSGTRTRGNVEIPDSLLTHSQEEADTLIVLHALTLPREAELVVTSPDTDVMLLLVHKYPHLPVSTVFLTGKGKLKRSMCVRSIYTNLGQKRASALLGFHAMTGSDMSGRFAGRSKEWCFKAFMSCDEEILDALAMLGNGDDLPSETCSRLEHFVCLLYRSKMHTTVNELRWFLFSNRAAEGENLPPTSGSLHLHIRRAHYIAMIWRKAGESHPSRPTPSEFGWEFDTNTSRFSPLRCLNPPAPEAVLNLVRCGCKRECEGRCSCCKNNIPCTEVCGCWAFSCNNKANRQGVDLVCEED